MYKPISRLNYCPLGVSTRMYMWGLTLVCGVHNTNWTNSKLTLALWQCRAIVDRTDAIITSALAHS